MKNMKQLLVLGAGLLTIGLMFSLPKISLAYRGDPAVKGPNYTEERHLQMEQAFENNDYNAWKELMQNRGRVTQVINQDNFARFAQAHRLAEEGKLEEARQIRSELGLGLRNGSGEGMRAGCNR